MPRRPASGPPTAITLLLVLFARWPALTATPERGDDGIPRAPQCHASGSSAVRSRSPLASAAIEYGLKRSPSLRALVAALQETDIVAYIDSDLKPLGDTWGHVAFISKTRECRYVRIAITAHVNLSQAAALLAHELEHVSEIAAHPEVVDSATLGAMYERFGHKARYENSYESEEAVEMGARVAAELMSGAAASAKSSPAETER